MIFKSIHFSVKHFAESALGNKALSAFAIYFLGTIIIKGLSLISTPIFTRILTTTEYGIISIYFTWGSFFAVFIGLQLSGSIPIAQIHMDDNGFSRFLKSILSLSFMSFLLISVVVFIFKDFLSKFMELDVSLIPYLLIQAFGVSCSTVYLTYAIQTRQPKKHLAFSVISVAFNLLLSVFLVLTLNNNKYTGRIIGALTADVFIVFFVYFQFYFKNKSEVSIKDWKFALPLSLPLIIHLLSNIVTGQSGRVFILKYDGFDSAAIYSVSYAVGSLGLLFAEATNNVWSPWYLDKTKREEHVKVNQASKSYILLIALIFCALILVSPEILKFMAPREYFCGLNSLIIVTVSVFFLFLYRFPLGFEQYSMNMKWVAVSTISAALINLLFNYLLIPRYGFDGAAYSALISFLSLFIMHEIVARRIIRGFNIKFTNYVPGIAGVVFTALIFYFIKDFILIRLLLLASVITAFASYFVKLQSLKSEAL